MIESLKPLNEREGGLHDVKLLEPRAGPNAGGTNNYPVYEYPENPNGPTNAFNFETPTYPSGDDGEALDAATGRNERWALNNHYDCDDTTVTSTGIQGVNWDTVDSDHMEVRSIIPNHFLIFV